MPGTYMSYAKILSTRYPSFTAGYGKDLEKEVTIRSQININTSIHQKIFLPSLTHNPTVPRITGP